MSDDTPEVPDAPDEPEPAQDRPDLRQLREKAKKADALEAEKQQLERDLAFARAGIPLDDPKATYFVKGYDGDATPEAIRQAWTDAGFAAPAPVTPQEQAAHLRLGQAAQGAAPPPALTAADELTAKAAAGEIRDAYDIARFLEQRDPESVSYAGPQGPLESIVH